MNHTDEQILIIDNEVEVAYEYNPDSQNKIRANSIVINIDDDNDRKKLDSYKGISHPKVGELYTYSDISESYYHQINEVEKVWENLLCNMELFLSYLGAKEIIYELDTQRDNKDNIQNKNDLEAEVKLPKNSSLSIDITNHEQSKNHFSEKLNINRSTINKGEKNFDLAKKMLNNELKKEPEAKILYEKAINGNLKEFKSSRFKTELKKEEKNIVFKAEAAAAISAIKMFSANASADYNKESERNTIDSFSKRVNLTVKF